MVWIATLVLFVIAIAIAFSVAPDLDVNAWNFDSDDIGWAGGLAFLQAIVMFVIALVVTLAVVVWAIVWMVRQGEPGPNRFGPDPRALDAPEPPEAS